MPDTHAQVEHPCTEMVTQVNLPAVQLQIGMGLSLNRIADIRSLYREVRACVRVCMCVSF